MCERNWRTDVTHQHLICGLVRRSLLPHAWLPIVLNDFRHQRMIHTANPSVNSRHGQNPYWSATPFGQRMIHPSESRSREAEDDQGILSSSLASKSAMTHFETAKSTNCIPPPGAIAELRELRDDTNAAGNAKIIPAECVNQLRSSVSEFRQNDIKSRHQPAG